MGAYESRHSERANPSSVSGLNDDMKKVVLSQHASVLREYANKSLVRNVPLNIEEERDRQVRAREYLAIGRSFALTDRMLVAHVLQGLQESQRDCDCPTCKDS